MTALRADNVIDFPQPSASASQEALFQQCRVSKAAVETSWRQHLQDVLTFRAVWQEANPKASWEKFCNDNPDAFYKASSYRTQLSSLPIAELVEELRGDLPSKGFAKTLQGKLWEVIPEDERTPPLLLSVLAICYGYEDKAMPDKQAIAEAFAIVQEEREFGTISFDGNTYHAKTEAHNARIKEAVVQTIIAHSKPQLSRRFVANQAILTELAKQVSEGKELPPVGAEITILWNRKD